MPRYNYHCLNEKCERYSVIVEEQRSVDDRNRRDICKCGEEMSRAAELTSAPQFKGEHTPKFHR
jgi:hypothetical protein